MADQLTKIIGDLRQKVKEEGIYVIEDDQEFYFLVGQIGNYLTSIIEHNEYIWNFTYSPEVDFLKREVVNGYAGQSNQIPLNKIAPIHRVLQAVLTYIPENDQIDYRWKPIIMAGLVGECIL